MIRIDPNRLDLVEAVRRNPLGPHSAEVQDLLALLRGDTMANRLVIVTVRRRREWAIGRLPGQRYKPIEILDLGSFTDPAEAEWTVFKLRWQEATGLAIDDPNGARTTGAGKPEPLRKSILGYCDPWQAAPGEKVLAKISSETGEPYRARIVRVETIEGEQPSEPWIEAHERKGRRQRNPTGSYISVPHHAALDQLGSFTASCLVLPTLVAGERRCLVSKWDPGAQAGFALELAADGRLHWRVGAEGGEIASAAPLRQWSLVWGSYDEARKRLEIGTAPVRHGAIAAAVVEAISLGAAPVAANRAPILMGALARADGGCEHHFNGKLDRVRLANAALDLEALRALHQQVPAASIAGRMIAAWDFAAGIGTTQVHDLGPHALHGQTRHLPSRGVKGADWTGDVHDWRFKREHYSAMHFHEDDLADAEWQTDFEIPIPPDAESGLYALRLETKDDVTHAPLFVRPPRDRASAPIAFLASTATYIAYANYRFHLDVPSSECSLINTLTLGPEDLYIQESRHIGLSAYDSHADGSGVRNAARKRPALDLDPFGALWNLGADAHILAWLKHSGQRFDVITDEDVHAEGAALLQRYRCVVTAAHPEYWSAPMWLGLSDYLSSGGRLMYMGGNGFYWRIGFHSGPSGAIEVRRTEGGARYWAEAPGEYVLESAAQLGGLWRRAGEASNALVGVTTRAIGFGPAGWFVATDAARDPRAAFIFAGLDLTQPIGAFGLLGGGVVGSEIDATDPALGTPAHALVVATSAGIVSSTMPVPEEMLMPHSALHGGVNPAVRADMVFFETPQGGAVWSASTLNWASSLSHAKFDNNVARLTANVLQRFRDPEPFAPPPL